MGTPPLGSSAATAMIGREREIEALRQTLDAVRQGSASVVLIGGETGIGKTLLVDNFARESGVFVLRGACLPQNGAGLPYAPFVEMLRNLGDVPVDPWPPVLDVFRPHSQPSAKISGVGRIQLFQGFMDLFETLADIESPLLMIIEDIHWADRSTLDLFTFLISLVSRLKIMIVATFRVGSLDFFDPLKSVLPEWLRSDRVKELLIDPLSAEESMRLLTQRRPDITDRKALSQGVEEAGGNPYILEQIAIADDPGATPLPVRDLFLSHLERLPEDVRHVLKVAALDGGQINDLILGDVLGISEEEVSAALRVAVDNQFVVVEGGSCRFRQPMMSRVLSESFLPSERRLLHQRYASILAANPGSGSLVRLATHQARSGSFSQALETFTSAAREAGEVFAFAEARDHYQSALELWGAVADPERVAGSTKSELRCEQAEVAFLAGDADEACRIARKALVEVAPGQSDVSQALIYDRLALYLCSTPNYREALDFQLRAVALISDGTEIERAGVLAGLAWIYQFEGLYQLAANSAQEALQIASGAGAQQLVISAKNTLGNAIAVTEDFEVGLEMISEALSESRRSGNIYEEMRSLWNRWANLIYACRLDQALDSSVELIESLPRLGFSREIPEVLERNAEVLLRLGRWEEAEELVGQARDLAGDDVNSSLGLPQLHIARKEFAEAREIIGAKSAIARAGLAEMHLWNVVHLAALELAESNHDDALSATDRVVRESEEYDRPTARGHALSIGIRAAARLADEARKSDNLETITSATATASRYMSLLRDLLDGPGPEKGWKREIRAVAREAEGETGRMLEASDADVWFEAAVLWDQLSVPYREAYCRLRWSEATLESGQGADVSDVLSDVRSLATNLRAWELRDEVARVGGEPEQGELTAVAAGYGLTQREIEVLEHLVRGATNRQIAQGLFISEKTAGAHVSNILRKMDVANRGQAVAAATRVHPISDTE